MFSKWSGRPRDTSLYSTVANVDPLPKRERPVFLCLLRIEIPWAPSCESFVYALDELTRER